MELSAICFGEITLTHIFLVRHRSCSRCVHGADWEDKQTGWEDRLAVSLNCEPRKPGAHFLRLHRIATATLSLHVNCYFSPNVTPTD